MDAILATTTKQVNMDIDNREKVASRPVSRILFPAPAGWRSFLWAAELLPGSSDLPGSLPPSPCGPRLRSGPLLLPYLVLLRVGFSLPRTSPSGRCALTLSPVQRDRTFSPLPRPLHGCRGRSKSRRYIFCGTSPYRPRPSPHWWETPDRSWPLASTLPCGVRTFLPAPRKPQERSDHPACSPFSFSMIDMAVEDQRGRSACSASLWPALSATGTRNDRCMPFHAARQNCDIIPLTSPQVW